MNDDDTDDDTGRTPDDPGAAWVTPAPGPSERAPGINDAFEATYVETEQDLHRRHAVYLAAGIAVAVIAAIAIVGVSAGSTGSHRDAERVRATPARPRRTHASTTTLPEVTATTVAPAATAPTAAPPPTSTPVTTAAPATSTTTVAPPPTPRVTAPANVPAYVPVALPAGVGATIGACSWQPTGGGRYDAAGTVTNGTAAARSWTVTIHWLQDGREIAEQATVVNLGAGAAKPWKLGLAAPAAPADPFSCALSVG